MKKEKTNKKRSYYGVITGIVSGLVNGVFGGGGGMIVVPMLIKFFCLEPKKAHATALFIILPLSIVSALFYVVSGNLNFQIVFPITLGVILGGIFGALLLSKLSSKVVIIIFSIVMAFAGAKMLLF